MDALTAQAASLFSAPSLNATFSGLADPSAPLYGADLYAGTDPSTLNVFEKAWMNWYIWIGNPVIATGLMSFILHGA